VDTTVKPVAATPEGLEVPAIGHAGWFDGGARPGDPGRSVIIGHLDGASGPGVFENVPSIEEGTEIVVVDDADGVHRFAVTGKLQVAKEEFPADAVYGGSDSPVLVLVTCGGEYVEGSGYTDNVVIYARAV
jgi:sortase (surface protein transpeptidase)